MEKDVRLRSFRRWLMDDMLTWKFVLLMALSHLSAPVAWMVIFGLCHLNCDNRVSGPWCEKKESDDG